MRGIDQFEHREDAAAHAAISDLLARVFASRDRWEHARQRDARALLRELGGDALEQMASAGGATQRALVLALCERVDAVSERDDYSSTIAWAAYSSSPSWHWSNVLELVLARLLKKRHDYGEDELLRLIDAARKHHGISTADVLGHVERHVGDGECSAEVRAALEALSTRVWKKPLKKHVASLLSSSGARAAAAAEARGKTYQLRPLTAWSRQAVADLHAEPDAAPWRSLFRMTVEGPAQPRPSRGWQTAAAPLLASIGRERVASLLARWLELTPDGAGGPIEHENADVLRALVWSSALLAGDEAAAAELLGPLQVAAGACFVKVYNVGARCARVANACVYALGELATRAGDEATRDAAAAALLGLADSVSYSAAQRQIQRTFGEVAAQLGLGEDALRARAQRAAVAASARPVRAVEVDEVRELVARGALVEALAAAIEIWRGARVVPLTEAIGALGALVAESAAAEPLRRQVGEGNKPARLAAFERLAGKPPEDAAQAAVTLGALAGALDFDSGRTLRAQVEALEPWGPDPRLALALANGVENPTANDARAWQGLFNLMRRHGEAVALQRLEAAAARFEAALRVPVRARDELPVTTAHLAEVVANTPVIDAAAEQALKRLRAAIDERAAAATAGAGAAGGGAAVGDSPEELLAAIFAAPDDDGLRRVYADVLSEVGDPHGELIATQLLEAPNAAQRKRARELIRQHGREWLGPLGPLVQKQGLVFRRGFPAEVRVSGKKLAGALAAMRDPRWTTVERLDLVDSWYAPDDLFEVAPLRSLRAVTGLSAEMAVGLFGASSPWPLVEIGCDLSLTVYDTDDDERRREVERGRATVAKGTGLPGLKRLLVETRDGGVERWRWLLDAPLMKRLDFVRVGVSHSAVGEMLRAIDERELPAFEIEESFRSWRFAHQLGADGATLRVSYGGQYRVDDETARRLAELLEALPGAVADLGRLEIALPPRTSLGSEVLERLREAAAGLGARELEVP